MQDFIQSLDLEQRAARKTFKDLVGERYEQFDQANASVALSGGPSLSKEQLALQDRIAQGELSPDAAIALALEAARA